MNLIDRYIVRAILGSVLLVMSVLLALGALFVFIDQQDDIGTGHYTAVSAVWYTLLNLPQQAYELLPITALIGSLLGLGSLARGLPVPCSSRRHCSSALRCCSVSSSLRRCSRRRANRRRSASLVTSALAAATAPGSATATSF